MTHPAIEQLKDLGAQVEALRKQMKDAAEVAVKDGTRAIFAEYGDVLAEFGWTHYPPNNDDGDPTESYLSDLVVISTKDVEEVREKEGDDYVEDAISDWRSDSGSPSYGGWRGNATDDRHAEALEAVKVIYSVMDEKLSEDLFGEYMRVIFTPEGVDVESYWDRY